MQNSTGVELNRTSGEGLKSLVRTVLKERNGDSDKPTSSAIQTVITTRGYFVTQSDLDKTLYSMADNGEIEFVHTTDFLGGGYRLICK